MSALVTERQPPREVAVGVLRLLRPDHWTKNLLVFAAPLAAGQLLHPVALGRAALAFAGFCLAASAVYCVNDVFDAAYDAVHPVKRSRPVASGLVDPRLAVAVAVPLAALAILLQSSTGLREILGLYLAVNVGYALWLKRRAVIETAVVASGFVLRPLGGVAATGIGMSGWLLVVCGGGALCMVGGKRLSEQVRMGALVEASRPMTTRYSPFQLRLLITCSAAVLVGAYVLWAVGDAAASRGEVPWAALSTTPLTLALLRYEQAIRAGAAERPERVVLQDRVLQALGLVWLVAFALAARS